MPSSLSPWIKPTDDFTLIANKPRPSGGSALDAQFFKEVATGKEWLGKTSQLPLSDEHFQEASQNDSLISRYQEELLEKLGTELYRLIGILVPDTFLSEQAPSSNARELFSNRSGKCMYFMSCFIIGFHDLGENFIEDYQSQTRANPKAPYKIKLPDGTDVPLKGLGAMLAAADFLFDPDCIGNSGGNAGYVLQVDSAGQRYAQLVKIDAGNALSFYKNRWEKQHNPLNRDVPVGPALPAILFTDLNRVDQEEFTAMSRHILSIPRSQFEMVCRPAFAMEGGFSEQEFPHLINPLIERKSLFLGAFRHDINESLIKEIEVAQAQLALQLDEISQSAESITDTLSAQTQQIQAANQIRAQLAVLYSRDVEYRSASQLHCQTFQLPQPNPQFCGRTQLLEQLISQMKEHHTSVIAGLGGMGKTQLATRFADMAYQQLEGLQYNNIIWLHAETYLDGQFQALAEAWLKTVIVDAKEAIKSVYNYLRGKKALIIFDNAISANDLQGYLPPQDYDSPLHVLISSRNPHWGELPTLKLNGFTLDESKIYIESQLKVQAGDEVKILHQLLDGLPLAYSQVIAYIQAKKSNLRDFIQRFQVNQANLISHALVPTDSHPKTIMTLVALNLAQVLINAPESNKLITLAAYLAPDGIPIQLLLNAMQIPEETLQSTLAELERYSLIQIDKTKKTINIHRLVQEAVRYNEQRVIKHKEIIIQLTACLYDYINFDIKDSSSIKQVAAYMLHALVLVEHIHDKNAFNKADYAAYIYVLFAKLVDYHINANFNAKIAEDICFSMLVMQGKIWGPSNKYTAETLASLSRIYLILGQINKAKGLLEQSISMFESSCEVKLTNNVFLAYKIAHSTNSFYRVESADKPDSGYTALGIAQNAAHSLLTNNLEQVKDFLTPIVEESLLSNDFLGYLQASGCLTDALSHDFEKYQAVLQSDSNPHSAIINQLKSHAHNIATIKAYINYDVRDKKIKQGYVHPGILQAIAHLQNRNLRIWKLNEDGKLISHEHDSSAVVENLSYIDLLFINGNRYDRLIPPLGQEKECSAQSTQSLNFMNLLFLHSNLAEIYSTGGRNNEAKTLLKGILPILERYLGKTHIRLTNIYSDLASAYVDLGKFHKQKKLLKRALHIEKDFYDLNHTQIGITLTQLGAAYGNIGKHHKAKNLLEQALKIKNNNLGEDHLSTAKTLATLASTYRKSEGSDNLKKAKAMLVRALQIEEGIFGRENIKIAYTLTVLARCCMDLNELEEAKKLYESAMRIQAAYYGTKHSKNLPILVNLSMIYIKQDNPDECQSAITLLERALAIKEDRYGKNHIKLVNTLKLLFLCHNNLNNLKTAINFLKRLVSILLIEPDKHPELLFEILSLLFRYPQSLSEVQEMDRELTKVHEIYVNKFGKTHEYTMVISEVLGQCRKFIEQVTNRSSCIIS